MPTASSRNDKWLAHYAQLKKSSSLAVPPPSPRQHAPASAAAAQHCRSDSAATTRQRQLQHSQQPPWPTGWALPSGWMTPRQRRDLPHAVQHSARDHSRPPTRLRARGWQGMFVNTQSQIGRLDESRARGKVMINGHACEASRFLVPGDFARIVQRQQALPPHRGAAPDTPRAASAPASRLAREDANSPRGRWRGQSDFYACDTPRRHRQPRDAAEDRASATAAAVSRKLELERYQQQQSALGEQAYGSQEALKLRRKMASPLPAHMLSHYDLRPATGGASNAVKWRWAAPLPFMAAAARGHSHPSAAGQGGAATAAEQGAAAARSEPLRARSVPTASHVEYGPPGRMLGERANASVVFI
jgi:hypothetical protein